MRCLRKNMTIFSLPISAKCRKIVPTMAIFTFFIYISLVFYNNVYGLPAASSNQQNNTVESQTLADYLELNVNLDWPREHRAIELLRQPPHPTNAAAGATDDSYNSNTVTGTPKPQSLSLDDIFITVKTTKNYHDNRLKMIVKTWFQLASEQTWFFTDTDDKYYQKLTNNHMINTNCSQGHIRKALCCKMGKEFDFFIASQKKWWCHFDDDNYVNVPRLVNLLSEYSPSLEWYLGKPSISSPLEIFLDNNKFSLTPSETNKKITFWFATGGAGFCLSRALGQKMHPVAGSGNFVKIGDKIRFPDDVTMGFIIESILKQPLTVVDAFHSHLEPMEFIRSETFQDQVSFSYAKMKNEWNVVKIDNGFDTKRDTQRFYSLHCYLFPYFSFCPKHQQLRSTSNNDIINKNIKLKSKRR